MHLLLGSCWEAFPSAKVLYFARIGLSCSKLSCEVCSIAADCPLLGILPSSPLVPAWRAHAIRAECTRKGRPMTHASVRKRTTPNDHRTTSHEGTRPHFPSSVWEGVRCWEADTFSTAADPWLYTLTLFRPLQHSTLTGTICDAPPPGKLLGSVPQC